LRVLQEREFERVGGVRTLRADIRVLAATNRDLEQAVKDGTFRQDLYYRLNVVSLEVPPLRQRREDILPMAEAFASRHAGRCGRRILGLSASARACLVQYDWPGNVRELENAIERAIVLGTGEYIEEHDLPETVVDAGSLAGGYHDSVREAKRKILLAAIAQAGGSRTKAAELLGLNPTYLSRLLHNLDAAG
jgi:DNA-binding NtrC family response regulator